MYKGITIFVIVWGITAIGMLVACKRMKKQYDDDSDVYGNYKDFGV